MKHYLRTVLIITSLFVTLTLTAQDNYPKFDRYEVVPALYNLSDKQMKDYDKIITYVDEESTKIKQQILTKEEKEQKYQELAIKFRTKVKLIFTDIQYKKWASLHNGYAPTRPYFEDMGMTLEQYLKFKELSKQYMRRKDNASDKTQSKTAHSADRVKLLEEYKTALLTLVSTEKANYIIEQNILLNEAKTLTKGFSLLCEYKAIQYALAQRKYRAEKDNITNSDISKEDKRKERKNLEKQHEKELRTIMSDQEYINCTVYNDTRKEQAFIRTYKLTKEQHKKYIKLQKDKAIANLQVKDSKESKTDKRNRIKNNEIKFRNELQTVLNAEQYQMWLEDHPIHNN